MTTDPLTDHGITTPNEGPSSSSKLSRPELSIRLSTRSIVSRLIDTKTFRLIPASNCVPTAFPAQKGWLVIRIRVGRLP